MCMCVYLSCMCVCVFFLDIILSICMVITIIIIGTYRICLPRSKILKMSLGGMKKQYNKITQVSRL